MAELDTSLRASRGTEQECSAAVSAAAARQAQSRMELEKAQAQLDREHEACAVLDSELGTVSEKFAVSSERRRSAGEQVTTTEQQSVAEQERVRQITVEIDDLAERMETHQKNEAETAKRHEETSAETMRIEDVTAEATKLTKEFFGEKIRPYINTTYEHCFHRKGLPTIEKSLWVSTGGIFEKDAYEFTFSSGKSDSYEKCLAMLKADLEAIKPRIAKYKTEKIDTEE